MWTVADIETSPRLRAQLDDLLARFSLHLQLHAAGSSIPMSYWGEPEAGIERNVVHAREDTPLHSVLHEACHLICMDHGRRRRVVRDAGGCDREEAAVCYLQLCLAAQLLSGNWRALANDMDTWGYSFPTGSTADWFETDAEDARAWLIASGLGDWVSRARNTC